VAFHAGTAKIDSSIVTNGGRVLGITAIAEDMAAARALAYKGLEKVSFDGMQYRTDIGSNNG
jgi:phosphoribosylamine--glycine ligase